MAITLIMKHLLTETRYFIFPFNLFITFKPRIIDQIHISYRIQEKINKNKALKIKLISNASHSLITKGRIHDSVIVSQTWMDRCGKLPNIFCLPGVLQSTFTIAFIIHGHE